MRLFVLALTLVAAAAAPAASSADALRDVFAEGNELYEAGDYIGAIERYESLVEQGVADQTLFYNTGNAYYKAQDLGNAVLYYERALRLAPRDGDVRENLELAESQLIDKQFVGKGNRFVRAVIFLHNNLSTREMFLLASLTWLLLCVSAIAFVFRDTVFVAGLYGRLSVLSPGRLVGLTRNQDMLTVTMVIGFLFATTGLSAALKVRAETQRSRAVVVVREVPVYSSPAQGATLEFRLHAGTRVSIERGRADWVKIHLPGGLDGWVEASATKRI